jgi:hypothetical protein
MWALTIAMFCLVAVGTEKLKLVLWEALSLQPHVKLLSAFHFDLAPMRGAVF